MIDIFSIYRTPQERALSIAEREVLLRKKRGLTQRKLAERSGVTYASLRRFESTGKIALESLLALAKVLDAEENFDVLFTEKTMLTMEEIINENHNRG